jgi:hypothetical protein
MSGSAGPTGSADGPAPATRHRRAVGLRASAAGTAGLAVVAPLHGFYSIRWDVGGAVQTFRVTGWGASQHFSGEPGVAVSTTRYGIPFLVAAVLLCAGALGWSVPRGRAAAPLLVLGGAAVTAGVALTVFLDHRAAVARTATTPPEVVTAVTLHAGGWLLGLAGATALAAAGLACWAAQPVAAPAGTLLAPAPTTPSPAAAVVPAAADPPPPQQEQAPALPTWSPADFQRPRPGADAG